MKFSILASLPIIVFLLFACRSNSKPAEQRVSETLIDTPGVEVSQPPLPEPYATKSALNFSNVKGWPDGSMPTAPEGFKVQKFADSLYNPRWIYIAPNGDILVAEANKNPKGVAKVVSVVSGKSKSGNEDKSADRITLFRDKDGDGKYELRTRFYSGEPLPFGMVIIKDKFFVAVSDAVWVYSYKDGDTALTGAGRKIATLPAAGRHWTKSLVANAAGTKLYVGIGSASDHAEDGIEKEEKRGCIIEMNTDGSGEKIYASGLRNPVGMDWAPGTNTMWTAVNERDGLGDDLVPDFITSVKEGGFYGWPYSYYGQNPDPRIKDKDKRDDLVAKAIVPDMQVGAHTASLGFTFYRKDVFPAKYRGGAFIGQRGSWNRSEFSGYCVAFVPFKNGKPSGKLEKFLTGFMYDEKSGEAHGRPVGVAVTKEGALLVADDAGNTVWRVSVK